MYDLEYTVDCNNNTLKCFHIKNKGSKDADPKLS